MGGVLLEKASVALAFGVGLCVAACSSGRISVGNDPAPIPIIDSGGSREVGIDVASAIDASDSAPASDSATDVADGASGPTAGDLIAITSSCVKQISTGPLSSGPNRMGDVTVCGLSSAVFWKSRMAILCAGKTTTTCNPMTDPQFQSSTIAKDSTGASLDAAVVPYVEVSAKSVNFDYALDAGLKMGSVVAVVYKDRVAYGIIGTAGVTDVIGDASYAMASALGINPDPTSGGVATNAVTYIAFNGPNSVVTVNEDLGEAERLGQAAAAALIQAGK
jgi:hypothetical protein